MQYSISLLIHIQKKYESLCDLQHVIRGGVNSEHFFLSNLQYGCYNVSKICCINTCWNYYSDHINFAVNIKHYRTDRWKIVSVRIKRIAHFVCVAFTLIVLLCSLFSTHCSFPHHFFFFHLWRYLSLLFCMHIIMKQAYRNI